MIIKCLNIDLDNKEKLLKAKDEEIKELDEIAQQYPITSKNYDVIIKAKYDKIRGLNNLCADTIKDLEDVLIEIKRLKAGLNHLLKELGGKHNGGTKSWIMNNIFNIFKIE